MDDYTVISSLYYCDSFLISLTKLPNAQHGLSRLRSLHCEACLPSEFFFGLAEICHNIKEIELECGCIESNGLNALVKTQKKGLISFSLSSHVSMPLLVNVLSNKVNTLKHLKFSGHYRMPLTIFAKSPLESLTVKSYERVRKEYFEPLTLNLVQKLWKLELNLVGLPIESLVIIVRNSGTTLREIYLQWSYVSDKHNSPALFTSIAENCTQLNSLSIPVNSKTILKLDEITCSNPHLKNLTLHGDTMPGYKIDISEGIVKLANSGFIPKKLEYLHFSHDNTLKDVDALDIFFSNAKTILTKPLKFKANEDLVEGKFIQNYNNIIAKHFIKQQF
ncbi:hypothetical protein C1645_607579 [Glomus cerebriforme]|uniref:F-box domain-containing protein n=1 Tax=Glomus cerebriforme TaxID=658196 RepID=A0A397T7D6_9GLOM|nr:hypothetical protein C1645_607579 [Glomus cerebriforme]